ncbi:MAG TPA: protein phosphatase 2C domain-containing protein [Candidatus Stackebrandtia excrementipullorum]|nr:protein phosphatase 2C domain-containing protein [Candidatus Stackebrandtia excrementipullorum]
MNATTESLKCPVCGEPAEPGHLGCEACGADLHAPVSDSGHWLSSTAPKTPCTECGGDDFGRQGYCTSCGKRRTRTSDRTELDLSTIAAATDFGKRHSYNQDAMAIGRLQKVTAGLVCDGVSSSTFSELAALDAVEAGIATTLAALADGRTVEQAAMAAVQEAQRAAAAAGRPHPDNPPSCTYVGAILSENGIHITWIGDSRAYWVTKDRAYCLTVDDTHTGRLAAMNVPSNDERYHTPYANALLCWLGADAPELEPNMRLITPDEPGLLVICSDGLSGYLETDDQLAHIIDPALSHAGIATALTEWARRRGGRDNISVVVAAYPPVPMDDRKGSNS